MTHDYVIDADLHLISSSLQLQMPMRRLVDATFLYVSILALAVEPPRPPCYGDVSVLKDKLAGGAYSYDRVFA